jgi:predicted homoserine dehydrogenase-like protein
MILVDRALETREQEGQPIRVGLVGAGFMGRPMTRQITHHTPGMEVVAIASRTISGARRAFSETGVDDIIVADSPRAIERAWSAGRRAVTDDPSTLCEADTVDVVVEVTGTIDPAAATALHAIRHGKHLVAMNAEVDGTVGPILKHYADRAGVVYTASDGDQPGVQMNLVRFVKSTGFTPLVVGNIKGLQDPYRTPTTQEGFARRWRQKPRAVTSYADGTKISFEQATVANGLGFRVEQRGMLGRDFKGYIDDAVALYDVEVLRQGGGVVDYVVGAEPAPGVYVFATTEHADDHFYLELYKRGTGPLYSFYRPYHLCHFEVPASVARAALFGDATLAPIGAPCVEVVTTAKTDLNAGTELDGLGGYTTYGQCENAEVVREQRILPMGVSPGCRLRRPARRDEVLAYDDVELPDERLVDRLRAEQDSMFAGQQDRLD